MNNPKTKPAKLVHVVAKRKASVAKCWLIANGSGRVFINKKPLEQYFSSQKAVDAVNAPFQELSAESSPFYVTFNSQYDVMCTAMGGGFTGQSEACRRAIAVALCKLHPEFREVLKPAGFLKSDSRKVEPKKYGFVKARKKTQFSKR